MVRAGAAGALACLAAGLFAFAFTGCAVPDESATAGAAALSPDDDLAELDKVIGDDRVGRSVRARPDAIPYELDGVERFFGIGRACARTDSKEIFVAEEKSSRLTGSQVLTPDLSPRLVVGGCNRHPADPSALRETFELFLAVVSDPARTLEDPLATSPVEAMALDDTTGLFNFYVLEPPAKSGATGTVTRFVRRADDVVEKWQKVAGKPATKEVHPDRKCFSCHVHGDPIMNELTEPWTNWVSSHKRFSRPLASTSRALVSEARPFGNEHTRSSLANQLEQVTRASIATWVEGIPGRAGTGLGPQILSGAQPGGVHALLKSVFCETTVNYASAFDTVPIGLFVDESAANYAALEPPVAPPGASGASFALLPVRAEVDIRIERFLQKQRILKPDTVLAVRLLDDTHDVFSPTRCAVHSAIAGDIAQGKPVDATVRAAVLSAISTTLATTTPQARAFVRALLDPAVSPAVRDESESAYLADLGARLAADAARLDTEAGRSELATRWRRRQAAARALFPTAANPLPITQTTPPSE